MSAISTAVNRISLAGRLIGARGQLTSVAPGSPLRSPAAARRFVDGAVGIAGWLCLIGLCIFWGASTPGLRWSSTFYWPNPFAAFLLLVLPVELSRYVHATGTREALPHGALSVLLAGSLVLTYTRGAWVSLLLIVPLALLTVRPASWTRTASRLALAGLATAIAVAVLIRSPGSGSGLVIEDLFGRVASASDAQDYAVQGRLRFWRAGLAIFMDHPMVGTGPGTFGAMHTAYQRDVRYYARDAHSLYVQTASEGGVMGLAALAVMLSVLVATWVSALRATSKTRAYPLVVGIGLGLAAFFVHSGLDMDWMFPANPAMAMLMAGALAWFAEDGVADPGPVRSTMLRWQRPAGIGTVLFALGPTPVAHPAARQLVRGQALEPARGVSDAGRDLPAAGAQRRRGASVPAGRAPVPRKGIGPGDGALCILVARGHASHPRRRRSDGASR